MTTHQTYPMGHRCSVPGCPNPATTYGPHCANHKKRLRRHGHPQQATISKKMLAPYLASIEAIIERNGESSLWAIGLERWDIVVRHARERVAYDGPMSKFEREACHALIRVADDVEGMEVLKTVCAFQMLLEAAPRHFRSDQAIDHQLARRVLALTVANAATYWDSKTKRVKRVYRDMPPRVIPYLVGLVRAAFGELALLVVRREREREREQQEKARAMREAAEELV